MQAHLPQFALALTGMEHEQFFPRRLRDPFAIQQLDWLRAIERGADPETGGQEGLRDLACTYAILESAALERQVTLDEMLDGRADAHQHEIDEPYRRI